MNKAFCRVQGLLAAMRLTSANKCTLLLLLRFAIWRHLCHCSKFRSLGRNCPGGLITSTVEVQTTWAPRLLSGTIGPSSHPGSGGEGGIASDACFLRQTIHASAWMAQEQCAAEAVEACRNTKGRSGHCSQQQLGEVQSS